MKTGIDMLAQSFSNCNQDCLSIREFNMLSSFINSYIGIRMPSSKMKVLESRLRKRLRDLQIESFKDYCNYLFSDEGMEKELTNFINVVTTNKTDFFRGPSHFQYLFIKVLPEFLEASCTGIKNRLLLWSAACSRGNEAYSIALVLSEYSKRNPGVKFDYTILATDISTAVLEEARRAIYQSKEIEPVPRELRMKYFMKSINPENKLVRIVPELRSKIRFRRLNLMDDDFQFREQMDVIFCRNVFIYFDKKTQNDLTERLCDKLRPNGYLFMGNSEMLCCRDLPLVSVAPSIYKKII